jgi:alkylated DNA repair dioxygenase AlkB
MRENLLPDAQVFMVEDAGLRPMFDDLRREIEWTQGKTVIYGKVHNQPRLTALYGAEPYEYSGVQYNPESFNGSPALCEAKKRVEEFLDMEFNSVVCNLYRDGQDSIGWHSDNEPEMGWNPVIASLSFGATRKMSFRRRPRIKSETFPAISGKDKDRTDIELPSGSLLVMFGPTQQNWEHAVLKTKKVTEPRINLTFRNLKRR